MLKGETMPELEVVSVLECVRVRHTQIDRMKDIGKQINPRPVQISVHASTYLKHKITKWHQSLSSIEISQSTILSHLHNTLASIHISPPPVTYQHMSMLSLVPS